MGDLHLWVSQFGSGTTAQLAVYLGHQTFKRNVHIRQLVDTFNLTEKEASLTAELCNGHASLEDAAENLGIGISTARSHLKRIFSKTSTQRQADLIKMVLINPILTLQQSDNNLSQEVQPSAHTRIMRLPSGRTLSYAEHGDPKGKPLLFCHPITGCRLMLPKDSGMLKKHRLRLIVPDRAGYGLSSPAETDPMQQWLQDMHHFLPLVGIDQYGLIGHSAGGAHAMALASEQPDKVRHLCLISSVAPLSDIENASELLPVNRMIVHLARNNPCAARSFLKLSLQAALKKPDSYFKLITNSVPDLDKEVLNNPQLKQLLLDTFSETTRQGNKHLIEETMYLSTLWQVRPEQISCPVSIWHGTEDKHAPFSLMQAFSRSLGQVEETKWYEGAGHYMLFLYWDEIVENLCRKNKNKPKR